MLFILLLTVIALVLFLFRYQYSYWKRQNVDYIPPHIPYGNLKPVVRNEKSFGCTVNDLYNLTTKPFIGIYLFFRPALLIRDPSLIKRILITDFEHFHDRGVYCNEKEDPMSAHLFSMEGTEWKTTRSKMSPAFSSGKLKMMFHTMQEIGEKLQIYLEKSLTNKDTEIELKDLCSRYVVDVLGSTIFGIDCDSINNPDDYFRNIGKNLAKQRQQNTMDALRSAGTFLCPNFLKYFRIKSLPPNLSDFMLNLVRKTIDYRESNNVSRNDLMQIILQLRNTGSVGKDLWTTQAQKHKSLTVEECASNVFLFYRAGLDSSSSTICFCIYELSREKELMEEVQNEIISVLKNHNGQMTYESLLEMKLLEKCINETIRKYPGLPILNRQCTKDFPVPNSDFVIKKGTPIIIPLLGVQKDPNNFKNPLKFDPRRFYNDNPDFCTDAYYPFGEGPRNCLAFRMGKIIIKVGLVAFLSKFNLHCLETDEIVFAPGSVGLNPVDGVYTKVNIRQ